MPGEQITTMPPFPGNLPRWTSPAFRGRAFFCASGPLPVPRTRRRFTTVVNSPTTDLPGHARRFLTLLGLGELVIALYALHATVLHRDDYLAPWQYAFDLSLFGALALTGLGLMRQRRWAARVSVVLAYLAFMGVLATLSLYYDPRAWWYWLLPPLLPALGYAIYLLRRARERFRPGW